MKRDETRKTKVSKTNIDQSKKKDHNYKKKNRRTSLNFYLHNMYSKEKREKKLGEIPPVSNHHELHFLHLHINCSVTGWFG
jgi:hypothetical protein